MKVPTRASTMAEFQHNVQEAIYEVGDMIVTLVNEQEGIPGAVDFAQELESQLKKLLLDIESDEYVFKDKDLPFMSLLQDHQFISASFQHLLQVINETHRKGLLTEEE